MSPEKERAMEEAASVLLDGLTRVHLSEIAKHIQVDGRQPKNLFRDLGVSLERMRRKIPPTSLTDAELRDRILLFVWRRLNATVLLGVEDR